MKRRDALSKIIRSKPKKIKIQSAKDKGRRLQKWVCQRISELTGFPCGKDCPIESRPMGQSGVDVRLEKQVLRKFPFSVECKSQESWNVHEWIKQAKGNQIEGTDWLLVCKRSREEPVVIINAKSWFKIMQKAIFYNNPCTKIE